MVPLTFNIVLYQPEIPYNTGNIARTCAATGTRLHLIRPLGFSTEDRMLKRAGCDYWHAVDISYYDSYEHFKAAHPQGRFFCVETTGGKFYTEFSFQDGDFFILGKESTGIPQEILAEHADRVMRLPMRDATRSLNLSNVAAIVIYEALRQTGFPGMK
ncbi:tRNA (uridine(34)/cytosine(34)/5-carboxymethylaminomethyluridine (34)-2'-O)-methyltransferase TrmL [Bacillaceae bacterium]